MNKSLYRALSLLFVWALLCCPGCQPNEKAAKDAPAENFLTEDGSWPMRAEKLQDADNHRSVESLITRQYTEDELFPLICNHTFLAKTDESISWSGYNISPDDLNKAIPIECLRTLEDGRLYAVYQMESGARMFVFFKQTNLSPELIFCTHALYWPAADEPPAEQTGSMTLEDAKSFDPLLGTSDAILGVNCLGDSVDTTYETYSRLFTLHPYKDGIAQYTYTPVDGALPSDPDAMMQTTVEVTYQINDGFTFTFDGQVFDCSVLAQDIPT